MKKYIITAVLYTTLAVYAQNPFNLQFTQNTVKEISTLRISFTGDILVHKDLYLKVIESKKEDFSILWKETIPLISKADISYGNLEGPTAKGITSKKENSGDVGFIYDDHVYSGTNFLFNYHPNIIKNLITSGFDIVSTANNHTFDRGSLGIDKTIDELNAAGLAYVGTRKKNSSDIFYTIIEKNGFKTAWISCSELLNGFKDRYSQILLCYEQADEITKIIKDLIANKKSDLIFVLPHWGTEYAHEPNAQQKKYARMYLDAGATAVVGSHPHVLQPVEKYLTKDGRETFIAYSLGNFLAYQRDIDRKTSAFVYLDFGKSEDGKTWIKSYAYEPTTRISKAIYPAGNMTEIIKHSEKFLGKYTPIK